MKTPKKFLCRFPLKRGAQVTGIIMSIIMIASCIAAIYQVVVMKDCDLCSWYAWRNAYAFSVIVCIYCFFMLAVNLWFLWGIQQGFPSMVLTWMVMTSLWLIKSITMVIVMLCMYYSMASFTVWLISLISALIAIGIFIYLFLVVYGYWVQLEQLKAAPAVG